MKKTPETIGEWETFFQKLNRKELENTVNGWKLLPPTLKKSMSKFCYKNIVQIGYYELLRRNRQAKTEATCIEKEKEYYCKDCDYFADLESMMYAHICQVHEEEEVWNQ